MLRTELIVRYVDLTPAQGERLHITTLVSNGRPVEPMRIDCPEWLVIAHVTDPTIGERYVLYFLSGEGEEIDFVQRPTLDEAIDEVSAVVPRDAWHVCSVVLDDPWDRIPREALP